MNIVLDMDQTLIDGQYFLKPELSFVTPRPHLETFLKWCFENFTHVSIWTAANRIWYDFVYENCLKNILSKISNTHNISREFHFVFTSDKCNCVWKYSEWHGQSVKSTVKRLRKLHRYKSQKYKNYHIDNTIIIDDNPRTYIFNYGNGIPITAFETYHRNWDEDTQLLNLITYLRNVLLPHYEKHKTILFLEKRYWMNYIEELNDTNTTSDSENSLYD